MSLHGASGIGKTYVVQQLMENPFIQREHHFYHNFSEDVVENAKFLLHLVFFLLFPYVNPEEIDLVYLKEIGEQVTIAPDLLRLAEYVDTPTQLEEGLRLYCDRRGSVFPASCEWKQRYVFLDNSQNLNSTAWQFLLSILREQN